MRLSRLSILGFVIVTALVFAVMPTFHAAAVTAADWKAGLIIDDQVFTNANSMSVQQIQNFLNSKVTRCDTNGTGSVSGTTRAQYGAQRGNPAPFTCLKDYYEVPKIEPGNYIPANNYGGAPIPAGARSAAQLIWDAAHDYNINPQVLLITLQKEQGLVTDDWPFLNKQLMRATGAHCPDSADGAVCDPNYAGLSIQLREGAALLRGYLNNMSQAWWPYKKPYQTNYILWNTTYTGCGGSDVYVQSQATAALYTYTPYQPNQAALNAGYGTGDGCSAYGNRNFWLYFNDWFGSPNVFDPYGWDVIRTENDGRYFLVVGNTKRWIPNGDIYNDWKLFIKPVSVVSQQYMDSIPTLPQLDRLGVYDNRYYYVDGGKKYWLSDDALLRAWGQYDKRGIAAPAYIPLSSIPDGGEATFYVSQPGQNKIARIMNGVKYDINPNDIGRWNANPTTLSASAYASIPSAASVDYHVSIDGVKYLVDNGRLLNVNSADLQRDYDQASNSFVAMPNDLLRYLPAQTASSLMRLDNDGAWYVLRNGKRYYAPKAEVAQAWGAGTTPTILSSNLAAGFPNLNTALPVIAKDQDTGEYFLFDGSRHKLSGIMLDAIQAPGKTIPSLPHSTITTVSSGDTITSPIVQAREVGHIYTILNGELYHVPTGEVLSALGAPQKYPIVPVSVAFTTAMGQPKSMSLFVESAGTTYLLQNGTASPLSTSAKPDWLAGSQVVSYQSANFSSRFTVNSSSLGQLIQDGQAKYVISNGSAYPAISAYSGGSLSWQQTSLTGIPRAATLSYLVRSSDLSDTRIWLINNGTKQHIVSGNEYSAYSKANQVRVSVISPAALSAIPQANVGKDAAPLVYGDGFGFKLLNEDGSFFSFGDGDTVNNFLTNNPGLPLNVDTFMQFGVNRGNITRLIRDPSGKVYWVENGTKRWITNGSAYQRYAGTPLRGVDWNVVNWLPDGQPIN